MDKGLKPYVKIFHRAITQDDILKLLEIRIKRISKYDSFRADEVIKGFEEEIKVVEGHLAQLTRYAIRYFKELKKKYGKGRERKTEICREDDGSLAPSIVSMLPKWWWLMKLYISIERMVLPAMDSKKMSPLKNAQILTISLFWKRRSYEGNENCRENVCWQITTPAECFSPR